jgi:hypothetical protein
MAIIKNPKKPVSHSFPRQYATEQGVSEAVVLKWLAHKTRWSNSWGDGKKLPRSQPEATGGGLWAI